MTYATYTTDGLRCGKSDLTFSAAAHSRMCSQRGEPLLLADWMRVLMIHHVWGTGRLRGCVVDVTTGRQFSYRADLETGDPFAACGRDSLDEWLMERYTAFNAVGNRKRFFRVWHPPWPQRQVAVSVEDLSLLKHTWPWFTDARLVGANFSPGSHEVWMGRPHRA